MSFDQAMAILEHATGHHFDPGVMAVFREIAPEIHSTLEKCGEDELRNLLTTAVRRHFDI
jgi:HD-GYP domain-containing protein (c-di-GMP phosphodiesterase class II)